MVLVSPPSRGAWIEIFYHFSRSGVRPGRPPRGGRGLKYVLPDDLRPSPASPPSRGAWIEMSTTPPMKLARASPPLAGGVD